MKKSITFKMTMILVSIVVLMVLCMWFLNNTFAEKYYISREKASILKNYNQVKSYLDKDESQDSIIDDLDQLCNVANVRMTVIKISDEDFEREIIFTNMGNGSRIYQDILDYLNFIRYQLKIQSDQQDKLSLPNIPKWVGSEYNRNLETLVQKGYYVTEITDKHNDQRGLYLFGFTDDNYLVAMRVSVDGIHTSVKIISRFIGWIGGLSILLGFVAVLIYSYHYTRPIKAMAHVANQMAHLDFQSKVEVKSEDEIGELAESINRLSENLESTIGDLKAANLSLQQDIQKKEEIDEMRKEFLSHVSHELKTPIAIIQGYAEGLKEGVADDKESMDYYCQVISDEAQKMNNMVRKLLTLNQLEFGNTPLNISRFNLQEMICNKIASTRILMADKNISILFDEQEETYVWADEYMIEEVFTNYLTNAIHHVKEDGSIKIWFEKRESGLRTYVFNQGNPIPEEEMEKLWIKFYKVDKARTREYGGNGIGLSIVAATMNAHGKAYGLENREDGVAFYFELDQTQQ